MDNDALDFDRLPDLADDLADEFAMNPDQRTPCVLLLDVSYSMDGAPIKALNSALHALHRDLLDDPLARRRVELAVVTFGGGVTAPDDFETIDAFVPPTLNAGGGTPMGAGLERALDLLSQRTRRYSEARVPFTRPWLFLITDGAPTDEWQAAAARARRASEARRIALFAVGVDGADMGLLARIATPDRPPLRLQGLKFSALFEWLTASLSSASQSAPGSEVALPSPGNWAQGWGAI